MRSGAERRGAPGRERGAGGARLGAAVPRPGELLQASRGQTRLYWKAVPIFLVIKGFLLLVPKIHQWPHDLKTKQNERRPIAAFDSGRLMAEGPCVDFFFFFNPTKFRFPPALFYW